MDLKGVNRGWLILQTAILAGLIIGTYFIIAPIQKRIESFVDIVKTETLSKIEKTLGREISYSRISPSLFPSFEIRNLVISAEDSEFISIDRIRVSFSLRKIFSDSPVSALRQIRLNNADIFIDEARDRDLFHKLKALQSAETGLPDIIISGKNISCKVIYQENILEVSKAFFTVKPSVSQFDLQFRGSIRGQIPNESALMSRASADVKLGGAFEKNLAWADIKLRLKNFTSDLIGVEKLTFQTRIDEKSLVVSKIQDRSPFDLTGIYLFSSKKLDLELASEDFVPSKYITLYKNFENFDFLMDSVFTLSGSLSYNPNTSAIAYSGEFTSLHNHPKIPGTINASGRISGNTEYLSASNFQLLTSMGNLSFTGSLDFASLLPEGELSIRNAALPNGETVNTVLDLESSGNKISARADTLFIGKRIVNDLDINLIKNPDAIDFSLRGMLYSMENTGELLTEGSLQLQPSPYLQISLKTESFPVSLAVDMIGKDSLNFLLPYTENISLNSRIFLTSDFTSVTFAAPDILLYDRNNQNNRAAFAAAGDFSSIEVYDFRVDWENYQAEGFFSSTIGENNRIDFASSLYFQGIPYDFEGIFIPGETFLVNGSYDLDCNLLFRNEQILFRVLALDFPIPLPEETALCNINAKGIFLDSNDWEILIQDTGIQNFPLLKENPADIFLSARLKPDKGSIYSLSFSDTVSSLQGNGEMDVDFSGETSISGWLQLFNEETVESYSVSFSYTPEELSGDIVFENSPVARAGDIPLSGNLDGSCSIGGTLKEPALEAEISLVKGRLNNDPLNAEISLSYENKKLEFDSLNVRLLNTRLVDGSGTVDFTAGTALFRSNISGLFRKTPLQGLIQVEASAVQPEENVKLQEVFSGDLSGYFSLTETKIGENDIRDWFISFKRSGKTISLLGGPENSLSGEIQEGGNFSLDLTAPLPIRFTGQGILEKGSLSVQLENIYTDYSALARLDLIPYFQMSQGIFRGSLSIQGPFNDPDFYGRARGRDIFGTIPLIPAPMGPINTEIVWNEKTMLAENVSVPIGEGTSTGDINFIMDHWIPRTYDIQMDTGGSRVPIKDTFAGINVDGYGVGGITVRGDKNGVDIEGSFEPTIMVVTLGELGEKKPRTSDYDLTVNLDITTGRGIEFFWPSQDLPILRGSAAAGENVKIIYDSISDTYSVVGDVGVQGGQVFYFSRNFYLKDGYLSFNENQDKFDPRLTMRAEIYEVTREGERVKIAMVLNDSPLSQFNPRFESEPTLPDVEILAMLGQDIIAELGGENINLTNALMFTGDIVSQFSIVRTFEERVKQIFNLDLFSIRTQMIQNLVLEKVLGQETEVAAPTSSSFGKYLDNTTILGGKYLGKDVFLELMLRFNSKNVYISDLEYFDKLEIESEISIEWETPIALLELTFQPKVNDLASSLNNTKLALSWRFSF